MINYRKIERIAAELEQRLGCGDAACLDERTSQEQEEVNAPKPCVEACGMTASEREAGLRRLIKMAKSVKVNKKLTGRQKQAALDKIRRVATSFTINKSVLDRPVQTDALRSMNTQNKVNGLLNEIGKTKTVNEVVEEVKASGMNVNIMRSLLSKPLGNIPCQEVIKLGPALARILREYENMKKTGGLHGALEDDFSVNDFDNDFDM